MSNIFKGILQFKICKAELNYKKLNPRNWKRPSFKKIIKSLAFFIIFLGALIIVRDEYDYQFGGYYYGDDYDYSEEEYADCNVLGIELRGDLVTYIIPENRDGNGNSLSDETASEYIVSALMEAEANDDIKAIILEIDSYGGLPVASYEINQALHQEISKPVVAMVRNAATSGAYLVAVAADTIFASPYSDIGGIGITMSYLDYAKQNNQDGLTYNSLSAGKYKDYGDPNKPLTDEEKTLIMRDLNIIHEDIIRVIATDRNLDINKVRALADGSSMPGQMAKDNGLIDEIGGITEVESYLKDKIGEEVVTCW
ncbi:MAG: S49 family peptidase [Candidatus Moranbacteria bacterium]|jgi:protease-4|nr:S49 family peptidase [Candidatus Moranbacteria bacterium]